MSDRTPNYRLGAVLVVDDDATMRELVAATLSSLGFIAITASCLEEALQYMHRAICVLCDVDMPGMNGFGVVRLLRSVIPNLPCLMMSGYGPEEVYRNTGVIRGKMAELAGASCYLVKPIRPRALEAAIRTVLYSATSAAAAHAA